MFDKITVALDLTKYDKLIIDYSSFISKVLRPEEVELVHIVKEEIDDLPDELREKIQEKLASDKEEIEKNLDDSIKNKSFGAGRVNKIIDFGNPHKRVFDIIHKKKSDLLILGHKKEESNRGVIPQKLTRESSAHTLLIPPVNVPDKLTKLYVTIDFSEYSDIAVEAAARLCKNSDATIVFSHIYEVPTGYHKTGKSYDEFAVVMKENAGKKFQKYISKFDLEDVEHENSFLLKEDHIAKTILEDAKKSDADIIIVGARGKTGAATFLLGSMTEELISSDFEIPMLIMKKKKSVLGFWDALMRI